MDPRERLLQAAERLFAEHGVGATSVRMITDAADMNVAAVNYHFGDKQGLVREIVRRCFEAVDGERCRRLEALEAESGPNPSPRGLLEAFVAPMLEMGLTPRGKHLMRLTARLMWDPAFRLDELFRDGPPPSLPIFDRLLSRAAPHLAQDPARRFWRVQFVLGATLHMMKVASSEWRLFSPLADSLPATQPPRELLLEFLAAGLTAPLAADSPHWDNLSS